MKRITFSIALLFAVMAAKAQTVVWYPMNPFVSSGTYTQTITSNSYTFDSDFLYLDFRLDADGHTMHYITTAKNIPYNPGDMMGEFQSSILVDRWPGNSLVDKRAIWNEPSYYDSEWERESYPSSSTYTYSGSTDIGSEDALMFVQGILIWSESGYFQSAGLGLQVTIIP
ncbi:MAG: hypothetical protein P0Y49_03310 [Candidatus Pedobacter colombiensis]|uniref:Uncharacterized protein n=1 Tax=Candidatus Pedobacter colombiensis TaxID=3121371 RepID=A0AAJ6B6M7_9SPHI|nr:hypothetical protein [Pedobacter sp.]WEK20177.1 MAG: hypothetical protein P0Y49_03310 [Pedobacter sp.]